MQLGCTYALVRHIDRMGNDAATELMLETLRLEIEIVAIREKRN